MNIAAFHSDGGVTETSGGVASDHMPGLGLTAEEETSIYLSFSRPLSVCRCPGRDTVEPGVWRLSRLNHAAWFFKKKF